MILAIPVAVLTGALLTTVESERTSRTSSDSGAALVRAAKVKPNVMIKVLQCIFAGFTGLLWLF